MQNYNETSIRYCYTQAGFYTGRRLGGKLMITREGNASYSPEAGAGRQALP